tara:strand:+ start:96 stop:233 length:138 start_codon:yes stop_codon:yes gene_type:complete
MKIKYYLSVFTLFVLLYWSCENSFEEAKIKMVLTGSVHGQLDPCG